MKIEDALKKTAGIGVATTPARGKGADKAAGVGQAATETDSVKLSATGQALAQAGTGGVFDSQKVEEIKAAIAKGEFKVDPEKVANGLLDTVSDLIKANKKG
ncbi:MAG TPA: flagellar biosynthesis anti-sigma factor FlgM [Noviherbaspirillum sp.]|uniref:flagellar biosynthesis anti-sigma factor FlgM n=1 Tax=Noviherbaspirillum sp. TaxID=1926288 RepID=UPI002F924D7C